MSRFQKCNIKVNKAFVKREIIYRFRTVTNYCKLHGISRMRLWQILNNPHSKEDVESLQKLAQSLDLSIQQILM